MNSIPDLSGIEHRAKRLLELLETARVSSLDFDNREHLQVIELCIDTAIVHIKKIK